jgi:hypothetical protein
MSSDWRLAKSLIVLTSEIEYFYPDTTIWDIGDKDHQDSWSDHNKSECCDIVCAVDVLADRGLDLPEFTAHLITNPHPNLRYVIFNRKIYQRKNGFAAQDYNGKNAHKTHVHVSVGNGPDGRSTRNYDSTTTWDIDSLVDNHMGDDMIGLKQGDKGEQVKGLQGLLTRSGFSPGVHDGDYGAKTAAAVLAMRKSQGSSATDGINFTGAAYEQLLVALIKAQTKGIKGDPGPAGPAGPAGKNGKDGAVKLPMNVTITGTVTGA